MVKTAVFDSVRTCGENRAVFDSVRTCGENRVVSDSIRTCDENRAVFDSIRTCGENRAVLDSIGTHLFFLCVFLWRQKCPIKLFHFDSQGKTPNSKHRFATSFLQPLP